MDGQAGEHVPTRPPVVTAQPWHSEEDVPNRRFIVEKL